MDTTLEQLARYVYQQLRQGVSEQQIRAALAQNRWTPDWIDAVFNVVHQNPNMFEAPAIRPLERPSLQGTTFQSPGVKPAPKPAEKPKQPMQTRVKKNKKGLVMVLIAGIVLLALVAGAYFMLLPKDQNKVQGWEPQTTSANSQPKVQEEPKVVKAPDEERKDDLNTLLSDLADLYVANKRYPTYDMLKSQDFAEKNPGFDVKAFADPKWSADNKGCTDSERAILAAKPAPFCYAYSASASDGSACDNGNLPCTRMTITTTLDDGSPYSITLDRNTQVQS